MRLTGGSDSSVEREDTTDNGGSGGGGDDGSGGSWAFRGGGWRLPSSTNASAPLCCPGALPRPLILAKRQPFCT
ncbi:hypothetical protein HZH68_007156 [Vespula germanica]|uniref:Uncharacterized protein n=2 Tax=Vespula TaxID=7451 RepID=A0A834K8V4_VESGE|nr:hypothetical protein HZH68_007156 [Vespula germanica]KAF7425227.1 hypothetical protein H0235_007665 [Vespula pensylvanica]